MSHQMALEARACSKLVALGMDGLKSWIKALPEDDRALLDGWLVDVEPVEDPEPAEPEPEPMVIEKEKMVPEYICQKCGAKWSVPMAWCANCGYDGQEEAA